MLGRKTEEQKEMERKITALTLEAKVKMGIFYYEKYLGGHEMYPLEQSVYIWLFPERMEITPLEYKTVLCYTFLRFLLLMITINDIMASVPTKATNPAGINIG